MRGRKSGSVIPFPGRKPKRASSRRRRGWRSGRRWWSRRFWLPIALALAVLVIYGPRDRSLINDLGDELVATWARFTQSGEGDMLCVGIQAVDGDTIKCLGSKGMRALGDGAPNRSGFDTPEIFSPKCPEERALDLAAKARLQQLVSQSGVTVTDFGVRDRYDRRLVWINLPDGRTAGSVLVEEGLARPWFPGHRADWCR